MKLDREDYHYDSISPKSRFAKSNSEPELDFNKIFSIQ